MGGRRYQRLNPYQRQQRRHDVQGSDDDGRGLFFRRWPKLGGQARGRRARDTGEPIAVDAAADDADCPANQRKAAEKAVGQRRALVRDQIERMLHQVTVEHCDRGSECECCLLHRIGAGFHRRQEAFDIFDRRREVRVRENDSSS